MSRRAFNRNLLELRTGIEACLASCARLPTLVLLYTAIDVVAWLSNDDRAAGVGQRFMVWVDQYLLKARLLCCTSADIYGARCGVVHKLSPDSDMSDRGRARQICYAWGNRNAHDLQELTIRFGLSDRFVCVGIEELYEAWQRGVELLVKEMDCDPGREARILARAERFFDADSTEFLDQLTVQEKKD